MPNQRMANGIQARGDRLRKKLIAGTQPQPDWDTENHGKHESSRNAEKRGHKIAEQPAGAKLLSQTLRDSQRRREN